MSATLYDFPQERIVGRAAAPAAGSDAVTVTRNGESLTYDTKAEFWAAVRDADPELKRRLADAQAAIDKANALKRKAEGVLIARADREAARRQLRGLFVGALAAGALGGLAFFLTGLFA